MYKRILVTLDTTKCDRFVLAHVRALAKLCGSRVLLLHVADGWAARRFGKDAVSAEIAEDQAYLAKVKAELEGDGIDAEAEMAFGEPKKEILKFIKAKRCDLVAMGTHGHRFIGDLLLGTTASHVQHRVDVPVLLVRGKT